MTAHQLEQIHPETMLCVIAHDPETPERPAVIEYMEKRQLADHVESVESSGFVVESIYEPTDNELRHLAEEIHCPNGY